MITSLFTTVKNKIVIPREVKYVYLKVNIENEKYYYFYSFNNEDWHKIDIALESKNYQMITSAAGILYRSFCRDAMPRYER